MGHLPFKCWRRLDVKCSRCNHIGHEAVICKANIQQAVADAQNAQENVQQKNVAQVVDEEEEQLFVATCFVITNSSEKWLIHNGYTNHMTFDRDLFKELDTSIVSKVKIGNGEHITVKGKGTVAIETLSATTIATSSAKPAKTHSVTRPLPSAGAVKDVDRKVIRRSGTHKEDTQRQGLKWPRANITTEEVKFKIQKPCKYFNSSRGCRNGSNCRYQHNVSGMSRIAKRLKLAICLSLACRGRCGHVPASGKKLFGIGYQQRRIKCGLVNILQKRKSGESNNLKVVYSGTKEFKIASGLRDLFLAFSEHQERLHKRLALEERRIFAADKQLA
ncbi:hypothetical protein CR513_08604, partial [Mucuna pruriens]